jgi:hypothetical protein
MAQKKNGSGASAAAPKGKLVGLTKIDAVRKAMSKLGLHAGRAPIRDYVKAQFGIEMTADHVSTCKADILRRKKARAKSAAPKALPAKPAAVTPTAVKAPGANSIPPTPAPSAAHSKHSPTAARVRAQGPKNGSAKAGVGINLDDILVVKDLVGRVGASQLKTLIDAFTG